MSDWIDRLNHFGDVWFSLVSSVVVQSVVVVAIAVIVAMLLRSFSASLRFWVWQTASLKLLLIPLMMICSYSMIVLPVWPPGQTDNIPVDSAAAVSPRASLSTDEIQTEAGTTIYRLPVRESPKLKLLAWAMIGWMLILLVQLVQCVRRRIRLSAFLKRCKPGEESERLRVQQLSEKLKLKREVVLVRGEVQGPLVTGVVSPKIILPTELELEQSSFDQIVLHELAHVKRRDLLWVWLPEVLRMLLFFHPLAY